MEYYKTLRAHIGTDPLILPGALAIITDSENRVLLQKRKNGLWGLPGGLMDLGESYEETVKREVYEETGMTLLEYDLMNVYSGKDQFVTEQNGDQYYAVVAVFIVHKYSGKLVIDYEESLDMRFFSMSQLPEELTARSVTFLEDYEAYMTGD